MKTLLLLFVLAGTAAATVVEWSNDIFTQLTDSSGTPLSAGMSGPGDGTILRLGYFDLATDANPFSGNFVVLAGGTIGDKGEGELGDGRFDLEANFIPGVPLPAEGMPLAIRFYDAPPKSTPRFFNTVSNEQGLWNWRNGSNEIVQVTLTYPGLVWEGGAESAFRTTIPVPVPEPSAGSLIITTMIVLAWRRRSLSVRARFNRFNPAVIASTQRHGFANHSRRLADDHEKLLNHTPAEKRKSDKVTSPSPDADWHRCRDSGRVE